MRSAMLRLGDPRGRPAIRRSTILASTLVAGAALAGAPPTPIGSFAVEDGPVGLANPPVYSCVEVCALLFGGSLAHYACSTKADSIDRMAFVDGWGDAFFCETPASDTFTAGFRYDCMLPGCSYSAYVNDHDECDGVTNYCFAATPPPDCGNGAVDPGEGCDDWNLVDGDCCAASCQPETDLTCDDGDLCNGDADVCGVDGVCGPEGPLVCIPSEEKASLSFDAARGTFRFAWRKDSIGFPDLGDPTTEDTDYELCVYHLGTEEVLSLAVPGGGTCSGKPCWKLTGRQAAPSGFSYTDKTGANDRVRSITLRTGRGGKAKVALEAKGEPFAPPSPTGLLPTIRARFSNGTRCFQASFEAENVKINDGEVFKATRKGVPLE